MNAMMTAYQKIQYGKSAITLIKDELKGDSINIEKENLSSVHVDEIAFPPKSPIKPNRRLIVTIGALVGMFSGIFLIFFIEFIKTQRKKHSE